MSHTLLYVLLVGIAMLANITTQWLADRIYQGPYHLMASILLGTGVGLVLKYIMDKRFIFGFAAKNVKHEGQTFILYASMGVLTTLLFWSVELAFHWLFQSATMRYLGAILGLSMGYWIKYRLDKALVFKK